LNAENRVVWREEFVAESDAAALTETQGMFNIRTEYPAFELWQEKRKLHRGERYLPNGVNSTRHE
jgi:hypothetical protein